jgi:SAM-dependent methyltransferase
MGKSSNTAGYSDYLRQRLDPKPGDPLYLHLSDLLLSLATGATESRLRILDYGAGLSPYMSFFPNSEYHRADLGDEATLDYIIADDGSVPAPSTSFDVVLSTQVAEHVSDPLHYFRECFRLLKPGGSLLLTTHGMFEDHPHPHDFQRWTAEGLVRDLSLSGFNGIRVNKLTTGPRALLFLMERCLDTTFRSRKTFVGFALWVARSFSRQFRPLNHRFADHYLASHRVVAASEPEHNIYVGLTAQATRPKLIN